MDRYQRVEKPKPESSINENEIRVTTQGLIRNYISYATTLLQEKNSKEIVLKAMGQAISKTVAIAEIIKKRVPWLHQDITISSVSITDVWEPIEDGLFPVETTRQVSMISITLSTKELNKNSPGYQAPTNLEQTKQQQSQPREAHEPYNAITEDSYGQGRGRGRGRGRGQDWGRGGYRSYQENGGYSNWGGRGGGRGRGWGGYRGSGSAGYERGAGGYERGPRGYDRGNSGYERGPSGYERGSRGYDRGNSGYERGSSGYERGSRGYDRGNSGYKRESGGYERGPGGYGRGQGGSRGYGRGRGRAGGRSGGASKQA